MNTDSLTNRSNQDGFTTVLNTNINQYFKYLADYNVHTKLYTVNLFYIKHDKTTLGNQVIKNDMYLYAFKESLLEDEGVKVLYDNLVKPTKDSYTQEEISKTPVFILTNIDTYQNKDGTSINHCLKLQEYDIEILNKLA